MKQLRRLIWKKRRMLRLRRRSKFKRRKSRRALHHLQPRTTSLMKSMNPNLQLNK